MRIGVLSKVFELFDSQFTNLYDLISDNKSNTCAFMKFNVSAVSGNFNTSKNTCFKQVLHDYVAFS